MLSGSTNTGQGLNFSQQDALQVVLSSQANYGSDLGISQMQAQIVQLQQEIADMGGDTTDLQNQIDDINTTITGILNNDTDMQTEIDDLQAWQTTVTGQISTLQTGLDTAMTDISTLQSDNTTTQGNVSTLQGQMATADTNISTLQSQMTTANSNISTLQGQMTTADSNIGTLQTDDTTNQGNISTLQGQMTTVQGQITTIEAEIAGMGGGIPSHIQDDPTTPNTTLTASATPGLLTAARTDSGDTATLTVGFSGAGPPVSTFLGTSSLSMAFGVNGAAYNDTNNFVIEDGGGITSPYIQSNSSTVLMETPEVQLLLGSGTMQFNTNTDGYSVVASDQLGVLFQDINLIGPTNPWFYIVPNAYIKNYVTAAITETHAVSGGGNIEMLIDGPSVTTGNGFTFSNSASGGAMFDLTATTLQAYTQKAKGFANTAASSIANDELVTWGMLKSFIDTVLPIGVLMISSNGAPPSSFGGYITWAVYSAANSKYLKMTTSSGTVGTSQSASLLAHTHGLSTVSSDAGGTHSHTFTPGTAGFTAGTPPTVTVSGQTVTVSGTTSANSQLYVETLGTTSVTSTLNQVAVYNSVSSSSHHTHAFSGTGTVSTVTPSCTPCTGTVSLSGGTVASGGSHSHTFTGGQLTDSTGTTNEVAAVYVLIYIRTA